MSGPHPSREEMDRILSSNQWCRHYAGIHMNATCKAGVSYAEVRVAASEGNRYPCFKDRCEGTSCASQSFLTDDEAWQNIVSSREAAQEFVGKIAANICPTCDKSVEHQRQVGPCVYADPCGHRLYQGRVSKRSS